MLGTYSAQQNATITPKYFGASLAMTDCTEEIRFIYPKTLEFGMTAYPQISTLTFTSLIKIVILRSKRNA